MPLDDDTILKLDQARLNGYALDELHDSLVAAGHDEYGANIMLNSYLDHPVGDGRPRGEVDLSSYEPKGEQP